MPDGPAIEAIVNNLLLFFKKFLLNMQNAVYLLARILNSLLHDS